jgi:hypothetical protein
VNRGKPRSRSADQYLKGILMKEGNVFTCHGRLPDKQRYLKTVGVLEEHINKLLVPTDDWRQCANPSDCNNQKT